MPFSRRNNMVGGAALLFLVSFPVLVHSQDPLLVRWNDSLFIDDSLDLREVIYHDEIVMRTRAGAAPPDGPGILICRVSTPDPSAGWRRPDDTVTETENIDNDFTQYRTVSSSTRVQLARTRNLLQDGDSNNGLWTCNGGGNPPRHVPLYSRGNGAVTIDSVSLGASPSFSSTSPRFTLIADTSGGPPTTFLWRNDAGTISSDSISIEVNPSNDTTGRMNCHYRSTLEVTAVAPGIYTYVADNRATSGDARMSFVVEGGDISNFQAVQSGVYTVLLTWDPPPGPPSGGYRVVDNSGNNYLTTSTSLTIDMLFLGDYNFTVTALSQHFPGGTVEPVSVTIRGGIAPVITLSDITATSVNVSWTQPILSLTVTSYDVAIRRLTPCGSVTNIKGPISQAADDMTALIEDLEEYIDYSAEVTANFQLLASAIIAEIKFTTLAIAPSEVPRNVVPITTLTTMNVSWNAIDCGNQNGPNFQYDVDFQRMDGGAVPVGTVNNEMFTVEGLQPFTNYTFRVRGVNDAGTGTYTMIRIIQTIDETPKVPNVTILTITSRNISVSWDAIAPISPIFHVDVDFQRMDGGAVPVGTVTNEMFTVEGLQPFTNYTFRVRGVNDAGNGDYTSLITIQTDGEAPELPRDVQVVAATSRTISVTWSPIDPYGANFRYDADFQRIDGRAVPVGTVNDEVFTVMGLIPFTNYTFQVRGVNDVGPGAYTHPRTIQTDPEAPEVPRNVVPITTSRTISVSWDAIENQNGPNFYYDVDFQQMDGEAVPVGRLNGERFSVEGLRPFTNYTFQVRGVNDIGNGDYTSLRVIQTTPEAPGIPSNVTVVTVTSRVLTVSWDPIDSRNHNGPNFRYEVDLQRIDGGAVPVGTINNDSMFTVEGLQPFTNYTFQLRGVNDAVSGNHTDLIMIETDQDEPGALAGFETRLIDYTSVFVSWNPPQEPNGIIIMYELTYRLTEQCPMSENFTDQLNAIIIGEVNSRITGIRVRAYTSAGPGPFAMAAPVKLAPSTVMNVQVESLTDTSVIVIWDRITDTPEIAEYVVYYAPVSSRRDDEQSVSVPRTDNFLKISGLESTVEYRYQVTAVALVFRGLRLEGERSPVTDTTRLMIVEPTESSICSVTVAVSVSVVMSVLLTLILYSALLLIGYKIVQARHNKHSETLTVTADASCGIPSKKNVAYGQVTNTDDMPMKENAAYVPGASSQLTQNHAYANTDTDIEGDYATVK